MTAYVMTGSGGIRDIGNASIFGVTTARTGGDTFDTAGFNLTWDQDSRYGIGSTTSTSLGGMTINQNKGGNITFDARYVRLIPYNTGSGTITLGATITCGSATGVVIGLYSAVTAAPVNTGVAAGFIKVTAWNQVAFPTSGAYTQAGFTFTITGADTAGWLEIVSDEGAAIAYNCYRLGTFSALGAWYEFAGATTTGTRTTGYQVPTNGSLTHVAGVMVQSATATITAATYSGGSITYTASGHGFNIGQELTVTGATSGFNCADSAITAKTSTTFTITATDPGGSWVSGGSAYVYDFYPTAGSKTALIANINTDAVRGRWCWYTTGGLIYFGYDGTNSTGGYIVPSGRKLRIANLHFTSCTTAARTANVTPNVVQGTRPEFVTSGGGSVVMDKVNMGWYLNLAQAFSVQLTNVATFDTMILTECASPIAWNNVGVGQANTALTTIALTLTLGLNFAGGTMRNCTWTALSLAASGRYVTSWADCAGFTVTNERIASLAKNGNATSGAATMTRVLSSTCTDCLSIGAGRYLLIGCDSVTFTDTVYVDNIATTTAAAIPMYVWELGTAASYNMKFDGLSFGGLTLVQPFSGILNINIAGCNNIKLRNLGTASAPLDMGAPYVTATWTRATTTMTVTNSAGHGMDVVGPTLNVMMCSDATSLLGGVLTTTTATLKAVAARSSATVFTHTCVNAGQTAGQNLWYAPCTTGVLVNFATGAAANGVYVQRCYAPHLRVGLLSGNDNSSKNIYLEDVWGTEWGVQLMPQLNGFSRGLLSTPALTAQTSCYGTHFIDYYTTKASGPVSAASWSRATTVCTVTATGHGMRVGDQVLVTVTSSAAAVVLGVKTLTQITAAASPVNVGDTFQFTCLNAGSASGTLTYTPLNGRVGIQMNETTSETTSLVTLSGGAAFTSAGALYMPVIGQYAIFTADENIKGHGSFPNAVPVMAGGTIGNYDITYSLDDGVSYKNLYYPRAGGGGSSASTTVTMTSTTGVAAGDYVFGTNIAPMAKVVTVDSGTNVTVDIANIGTVSGVLNFAHLPSETIASSATGTPLKVKIQTSTTNTTAIQSLYFFTNSSSTDRTATYPLDVNTLTLTGIKAGSEVRCYTGTPGASAVEIAGIESSGTSFAFTHSSGGVAGFIQVLSTGYQAFSFGIDSAFSYTASDIELPVSQVLERNYTP